MRSVLTLMISLPLLVAVPATAGWDEGVAAFTSKNYQQAVAEFKELVDQNPEGYRGHYMLGLSLQQLDRKEEALHHLRKAYDLNPNDLATKLALGRGYYNLRRYGEVAELLGPVNVADLPGSQQAAFYQMRSQARFKIDDKEGAVKDFAQLAKLKPTDAEVQYSYGKTALSVGQTDTAIDALAKAVQLDSKDAEKKRTYIQALLKKGRLTRDKSAKRTTYLKAANVAQELVASAPTYDNYMLKVSAELGAGRYKEAAETGRAAISKKGDDWLAHYYVGQALSSNKQYEQAEQPLERAKELAKSPEDIKRAWRQLGYVYEKQKEYSKAIDAYEFAGDQAGVARVAENEKTARYNKQVEEENKLIEEMKEEAKKLEEELEDLEGGEGGGL